jgi:hypothetical protein
MSSLAPADEDDVLGNGILVAVGIQQVFNAFSLILTAVNEVADSQRGFGILGHGGRLI